MKTLLTTILTLFFVSNLTAQTPVSVIESPELNVLYLGYENLVRVFVSDLGDSEIQLTSPNCRIVPSKFEENEFYVIPKNGKKTTLTISLIDNDSTVTLLNEKEYRIQPLPVPTEFLGPTESGGKAHLCFKELKIAYPKEFPLESNFKIMSWRFYSDFGSAEGQGSDISSAVSIFEKIDKETILYFSIDYASPAGIIQRTTATWRVDPLLNECE
ncbi:MAG: hypothetical protein Crog4KO_04190 [Crocinitomicaceae bacterium]